MPNRPTSRSEKKQTLFINIPPKASAGPSARAKSASIPTPVVRHATDDSLCQELLQSLYDGTLIVDADGRIIDANSRATEMLIYTRDEMLQLRVGEIVCGADEATLHNLRQNLESRKFILIDAYCVTKDRVQFPAEIAVSRFPPGQGERLICFIRNVTRRRSIEEDLRKSEARNRALLDAIPDLIIRVNQQGRILDLKSSSGRNPSTMTGDWMGKPIQEAFPELADGLLSQIGKVLHTREPRLFEYQYPVEGNMHHFESRIVCGGEEEALVIVRDMTDRKHLEAQLALAQKMEAIGQLTAGVAHEINSPIQYIGDNLQFLRDAFQSILGVTGQYRACLGTALPEELLRREKECDMEYLRTEVPKAIAQSLTGIERVTRLVSAMRTFSHQGPSRREPADINASIQATATISRHEWKYVADLETHLVADLPPVPCIIDQINQVILNMIVNAADAIREAIAAGLTSKGKIDITTQKQADFVQITIADTGIGIPSAIRHRIFDPFFTTKPVGKGSGQGLTIAHDIIVNKHGGQIQVNSVEKKGTTFVIQLPLESRS
jgi:PAS domain S-box-containing protein